MFLCAKRVQVVAPSLCLSLVERPLSMKERKASGTTLSDSGGSWTPHNWINFRNFILNKPKILAKFAESSGFTTDSAESSATSTTSTGTVVFNSNALMPNNNQTHSVSQTSLQSTSITAAASSQPSLDQSNQCHLLQCSYANLAPCSSHRDHPAASNTHGTITVYWRERSFEVLRSRFIVGFVLPTHNKQGHKTLSARRNKLFIYWLSLPSSSLAFSLHFIFPNFFPAVIVAGRRKREPQRLIPFLELLSSFVVANACRAASQLIGPSRLSCILKLLLLLYF